MNIKEIKNDVDSVLILISIYRLYGTFAEGVSFEACSKCAS